MDLESIKTTIVVAEVKSFSKAAFEIPCAQSSVSRRVKLVEEDLGVTLFLRPANSGNLELTAEGARLIPALQKLVSDYEALRAAGGSRKAEKSPAICLGVPGSTQITSGGTQRLRADFCRKYPGRQLVIQGNAESLLMKRVVLDSVDAMLAVRYVWNHSRPHIRYEANEELVVRKVGEGPVYLSISEDHPLAAKKEIRMGDLADVFFLLPADMERSTAGTLALEHTMLFEACRMSGVVPKITVVEHKNRAIRHAMVKEGKGALLCGFPPKLNEHSGVVCRKISDCPMGAVLYVVAKREKAERADMVARLLQDYVT